MNSIISPLFWAVPLCIASATVCAEESNISVANGLVSGNIGLVSKYVYRGGVENDDIAVHGGLEYVHKSGVSVGYWGSTLDYDATDERRDHGFEHDFYLAYAQQINPDWSYKVQTTAYVYQNGGSIYGEGNEHRRTTAFDVLAELAYKDVSLDASVLLADASFGNAGDVYLSASYSHALPQDFILNASIGGSAYNSSRDDSLIQTTQDFAFNEARIGVSKVIADTGVTASFDYVIGGEDRLGQDFDDNAVLGLNYSF
ncbi:TorF family putative porin [Acinetobacter wuhouensis]|uniref:Porin n=1 Tax=Acinetobacter wuhouensis TaxID=1879050 RepID=A0A3G2SYI4_9GAMM|nr:TorF family putative porin [Acinetobacter wuhouensis]AYO52934.1 hypothetical protein CDG68_04290 [Acinetobacter wuhouensis]